MDYQEGVKQSASGTAFRRCATCRWGYFYNFTDTRPSKCPYCFITSDRVPVRP